MSTQRPDGPASAAARGFTLIEILVAIAILAVMAAIVTPFVTQYVGESDLSRAEADVRSLATQVGNFHRDVAHGPVFNTAGDLQARNPEIEALFGPGTPPPLASGVSGWPSSGGVFDNTEGDDEDADAIVDQLMNNEDGSGSAIYPTTDPDAKPTQRLIWQGPYIDGVNDDPWGNAYLITVKGLWPGEDLAVFAVSAGVNGTLETDGNQPAAGELTVGGDDHAFRIN